MKSNGRGETRITGDGASEVRHPTWSPSGDEIAFASNRDGNMEIYVVKTDGTNEERLTIDESSEDIGPSWAPDGTRIAFVKQRGEKSEIFVLSYDTPVDKGSSEWGSPRLLIRPGCQPIDTMSGGLSGRASCMAT